MKNEKFIQSYLRENVKAHVDKFVYDNLYQTGSQPGKLYGMCKVHKEGYPLRPVISMINTAEYKLAKWLDSYIKPNIPTQYSVASTSEFLNGLNDMAFSGDDRMVSFDVVSLFTNIPLSETIDFIVNAVYEENSRRLPPVPKLVFKRLLEIATGGMFMYRSNIYRQVDGVAMGNPLGPSLANFFLGHIENQSVFSNLNICPKMYMRYVDDIFAVFPQNINIQPFLTHLNSLHKNLEFTVEEAKVDCPFSFLNVSLSLNEGNLETWVFQKKTDTKVILNYNAKVPNSWKQGLIRCLLHLGKQICSSDNLFNMEIDRLRRLFQSNGYPNRYFQSALDKFTASLSEANSDNDGDGTNREYKFGVPFVGTASSEYKKRVSELISNHLGVNIFVYFTSCKVGSFFTLKSRTPSALVSRVVYKFQCLGDPDTTYIGKTKRHIITRVKEHLDPKENSAITSHIFECVTCKSGHFSKESFSVLKKCANDYRCGINEALLIKKCNPTLNRQRFNKGQSYLLRVFN